MKNSGSYKIQPRNIRLEASTACQLKCPSCPTASGETGKSLGVGFLSFSNFKRFVDSNPEVSQIELSNWGEVFLNKEILDVLKYAYKQNVELTIGNGSNLNNVRPDVLEALVKYKLRFMTCSIDGASQETYSIYRVKGNYDTVINNIREINRWKKHYRTDYPKLRWQFVAFAHNEKDIPRAKEFAKELDMEFSLKLSWGDLHGKEFSPVKDHELIRRETDFHAADRDEYREMYGEEYVGRECCLQLWHQPQVNVDGRMLGCCTNYWGDYGNVFNDGLYETINNEKMDYARSMVMGLKEAKEGIPCSTCGIYAHMKKHDQWISRFEVDPRGYFSRRRNFYRELLGERLADHIASIRYKLHEARCFLGKLDQPGKLKALLKGNTKSTLDMVPGNSYDLPVSRKASSKNRWQQDMFFIGATGSCEFFDCHASSIYTGHTTHPPHSHEEEEMLLLLSGELELIHPDLELDSNKRRIRARAGDLVYYPAWFSHGLKGAGVDSSYYMALKWKSRIKTGDTIMGFQHHNVFDNFNKLSRDEGFTYGVIFEGKTKYLNNFQSHVSILKPGTSYDSHSDPYDVLICVIEGNIKINGEIHNPHTLTYLPAGQPHDMHNPGTAMAKYIVFEFHPPKGIHGIISKMLYRG